MPTEISEIGDYYATHSLLSTDDQALYPVDAWVAANPTLDSAAGEFVELELHGKAGAMTRIHPVPGVIGAGQPPSGREKPRLVNGTLTNGSQPQGPTRK